MDVVAQFFAHILFGFVIGVLIPGKHIPYFVGGGISVTEEIHQYLERCNERYYGQCKNHPLKGFRAYRGGYTDTISDVSATLLGIYLGNKIKHR